MPTSNRPRRLYAAAAILLAAAAVFFLLRSPFANVKNLDARGSLVIAFGDSLTAGAGAREGEDYASLLSRNLQIDIMNAGVSGDTTEGALRRLEDDVLAEGPRIVVVALGGNDFLRRVPIEKTESNLRKIIRRIQENGAMVALVSFEFPTLGPNYPDMYERVAKDEGAFLIEGVLDDILNDPALKSDEIHPNAKGYALMAERLEEPMRELIDEANEARYR